MVVLRDALKPLEDRQIWLAGGGDGVERDISEVLLNFDVLAIGPGEPGPYLQPYLHKGSEARAVDEDCGSLGTHVAFADHSVATRKTWIFN